jgi:hypothetical protein
MARKPRRNSKRAKRSTTKAAHQRSARVARATAEVSGQVGRAGEQILGANVETTQRVLESSAELLAEFAERSAQQLGRALQFNGEGAETIRSYSRGINSFLESSAKMARMVQGLSLEWMNFGRARAERNFDQIDRFVRFPQEFFAAQNELLKDNVEQFLARANRFADRSTCNAEDQVKALNEAAE